MRYRWSARERETITLPSQAMRKTISLLTALCALGAVSQALFFAPAAEAGLAAPVADCNAHAQLTHQYSVAQLRSALATMPADIKEYTNCGDVIQRALLAELGRLRGHGGSGQGGGSFLPTPLIVVLALLVLGGAGFAVYATRRRG
jgi:hypothetical protein